MDRNVIVFGATGNTGKIICENLHSKGINYATFVRKGSETKLKFKNSTIIHGDVLQIEDVKKAFVNQNFTDVIIALGSRNFKAENIRYIGTRNIVKALQINSIQSKLHVISAHGVGESWHSLKWYEKLISKLFIAKTMKDHELQEEIVKSNIGGYHIIRPVGLNNEVASGNVYSKYRGVMPNSTISRADVAEFLIDSMLANTIGEHSICSINS